jgi:hypothetical protein
MLAIRDANIDVGDTFGLLDVRAARALNILLENLDGTEKSVDSLTKKFKESAGEADKMAASMLDNVAGATKLLKSAQEGLALALGETFGASTQEKIENTTKNVTELTRIVDISAGRFEALGNVWNKSIEFLQDVGTKIVKDFFEIWIVGEKIIKKYNIAMKEADIAFAEMSTDIKRFLGFRSFSDDVIDAKKELRLMKKELENIEKDHMDLLLGTKRETTKTTTEAVTSGIKSQIETLKKVTKPLPGDEKKPKIKAHTPRIDAELKERIAIQFEINEMTLAAQAEGKEKEIALEKLAFKKKTDIILNEKATHDGFIEAAEEAHKNKLLEIDKKFNELQKKNRREALGDFVNNLGMMAGAFKKFGGLYKTAAISQTLIDTYKGAQAAFSALAGIPVVGPVLGGTAAAIATGAGLARVAEIKAQKFQGGGFVQEGQTTGDRVPILANKNELILNPGQQRNILALANGGGGGGGGSVVFSGNIVIHSSTGDPDEIASAVDRTMQERLRDFTDIENERNALQVT